MSISLAESLRTLAEAASTLPGHHENQIIEHVEAMFSALHFDVAGRNPHTGQLEPT